MDYNALLKIASSLLLIHSENMLILRLLAKECDAIEKYEQRFKDIWEMEDE